MLELACTVYKMMTPLASFENPKVCNEAFPVLSKYA